MQDRAIPWTTCSFIFGLHKHAAARAKQAHAVMRQDTVQGTMEQIVRPLEQFSVLKRKGHQLVAGSVHAATHSHQVHE